MEGGTEESSEPELAGEVARDNGGDKFYKRCILTLMLEIQWPGSVITEIPSNEASTQTNQEMKSSKGVTENNIYLRDRVVRKH